MGHTGAWYDTSAQMRNMLGIDGGALQTSFNCFTGQILLHFDINNILLAQIQQI